MLGRGVVQNYPDVLWETKHRTLVGGDVDEAVTRETVDDEMLLVHLKKSRLTTTMNLLQLESSSVSNERASVCVCVQVAVVEESSKACAIQSPQKLFNGWKRSTTSTRVQCLRFGEEFLLLLDTYGALVSNFICWAGHSKCSSTL